MKPRRSENNEVDIVYHRALRILSHREHSVSELRKKLKLRDFSGTSIDRALTRLVRLGLLDDSRFSEAFVREKIRHKPLGRNGLLMELVLKRGVPEDVANRAIVSVMDEEKVEEVELARSIVRKRDIESRTDIARTLRRRGFDEGIISAVIEERNDRE